MLGPKGPPCPSIFPLYRGTFPREWQRDRAPVLVQRAAWQSPCHAAELTGKAWCVFFYRCNCW